MACVRTKKYAMIGNADMYTFKKITVNHSNDIYSFSVLPGSTVWRYEPLASNVLHVAWRLPACGRFKAYTSSVFCVKVVVSSCAYYSTIVVRVDLKTIPGIFLFIRKKRKELKWLTRKP